MKEVIAALLVKALEKKKVISIVAAILIALVATLLHLPEGEVKNSVCGTTIVSDPAP